MSQRQQFLCVISDSKLQDRFSAQVEVIKRTPVRTALQAPNIELANIYITPISGQRFTYMSKDTWKKTPVTFPQATTMEKTGVHNHFVLYDISGRGLYITRDPSRKEDNRRKCTIWDLGSAFALQVTRALKELA